MMQTRLVSRSLRTRASWRTAATIRGNYLSPLSDRPPCSCNFSSTTTTTNETAETTTSSSPGASGRIARALYRQLIRWCQTTESDIPLFSFVPPIHVESPKLVDPYRLELLGNGPNSEMDDDVVKRCRTLLPPKTHFQRTSMTVPIHYTADLIGFFRAIYRLNAQEPAVEEHQKHRISVAFEALKSLNELTGGRLESLNEQRARHMNRDDDNEVKFRIGQVVQHQHERWRAVVAGWERTDDASENNKTTSLTSKDYTDQIENNDVRYELILDDGDSHTMMSGTGWATAIMQSDLALIEDESLVRIRSGAVSEYFGRFDEATTSFVPNELRAYEYPKDVADDYDKLMNHRSYSREEIQLCEDLITGVHEFAGLLERLILDETSCPKDRGSVLLSNVLARLSDLKTGNVLPVSYQFAPQYPSVSTVAAHHLRALLNLSLEVFDVMFQRKTAKECLDKTRFSLGDIVHHKVFGFRGVIVAWDPKPTVDVSRWDGLQHILNPTELPFYHVIPDQGDCVEAFGGERSLRYVCEENLEPCPENRTLIDVDLEPEWQRSPKGGSYIPPAELRFKYGEDLDDDGVTERCMTRILEAVNTWQLEARESSINDPLIKKLSMANMMALLKVVDMLSDAVAVQETIKEMRKAHVRTDLRWRLGTGIAELMSGKGEQALAVYKSVIEEDEQYAEAWNKRATCEFMMGMLDDALKSTKRTLELDPLNFQAVNGLGLIHFEKDDYSEAEKCFRKTISVDPWSPISSKLSICIDHMSRDTHPDELPS